MQQLECCMDVRWLTGFSAQLAHQRGLQSLALTLEEMLGKTIDEAIRCKKGSGRPPGSMGASGGLEQAGGRRLRR